MVLTRNLVGYQSKREKKVISHHAKHHSHLKDWNQTWFYCQNTAPAGENPLPGYRPHRLRNGHPLPLLLTAKERQTYAPQLAKVRALLANGLTGIDLVRCWVSWGILPLSRHPVLMHEYSGNVKDPQRYHEIVMTDIAVTESVKKMLDEPIAACSQIGLPPFCASNKPTAVKFNLTLTDSPPR